MPLGSTLIRLNRESNIFSVPLRLPTSVICSRSVELETKEPLLESSEPSALPLTTFVAEAEDEEGVELPLRNFDPEIMSGEVRCAAF